LLLVSFADKSGLRKKSAPLSPQISLEIGIAGHVRIIGVAGFVAGPHVHVIDEKGLADPLASRMRLQERGRPGHEKGYPVEWILARFGARDIEASPGVESARAAIDCGVLAELRRAIEEPLTPGRFLRNLAMAFRFHGLRISMDPMRARNEVCTD
jgi:arabinofuranosyltransferase